MKPFIIVNIFLNIICKDVLLNIILMMFSQKVDVNKHSFGRVESVVTPTLAATGR